MRILQGGECLSHRVPRETAAKTNHKLVFDIPTSHMGRRYCACSFGFASRELKFTGNRLVIVGFQACNCKYRVIDSTRVANIL
jgi:hypothetical protein